MKLHQPDTDQSSQPLTRRALIAAVPAVAALAIIPPRARAATTTIDASKSRSLQAAIDAAPDGATIIASRPGKSLGSATLNGRTGLRLDGLSIAGRLTLTSCSNVTIANCKITNSDIGVWMVSCSGCTVVNSTLAGCAIGGYSPVRCAFTNNTISNPPGNGIGFTGYAAYPCLDNQYRGNVIQNVGRIGIEEYPSDGAVCSRGTLIDGNRIVSATNMGVSAMGQNPTITNNTIQDAGWAAIEVVGNYAYVGMNTISSSTFYGAGICVNSTLSTLSDPQTTITGNSVTGLGVGITLVAQNAAAPLRNVTVSQNTVTNCADTGIVSLNGYEAGGIHIDSNVINLTSPPQANRNRIGLKTGPNISLSDNSITYATGSAGTSADMPIHLVGNNVSLANSTIDGGSRTNLLASSALAPAGTYTGWQYLTNRYINGAAINKSGTVATVDTDVP